MNEHIRVARQLAIRTSTIITSTVQWIYMWIEPEVQVPRIATSLVHTQQTNAVWQHTLHFISR